MKTARVLLVVGLIASCAVGTHASHSSQPPTETIAVAEFVVDPQSLPGSIQVPQRDALIRHLEDEATDQAVRTLREHHLANVIKRVAASGDAADVPVVSGDIRMPVELPDGLSGFDAGNRRGEFASVTPQLRMPDGTVKTGNPISLSWNAVWWLEGGRSKHNVPQDQVLAGFARKAADRGVREMLAVPQMRG